MAFTTIAYSESQDTAGVLTYVAGVQDQHVRVEGDNIIVPRGVNSLVAAFGIGATISLAQLESPSLRRVLLLDLAPLNVGAEPISPNTVNPLWETPLTLDEDEALRALVAEAAAGAERESVLVWLADGALSPVGGDIYTVRATTTPAAAAYVWANSALTFVQSLPAGRYQVVGMRCEAADLIAARLVFVGGMLRPGVIGFDTASENTLEKFRRGGLGVWGEFEHNQPPTVDSFSVAGGVAINVWLDLIKI